MTYVNLETGGSIKNQEKGYYEYSDVYEYKPQENTQVKIELDVNAGETKTDFIELKVNDLNNDDINFLIRIAVFHYAFGYIHPFYDGNGRTSRFISSYLLSQRLEDLVSFRLSYTIKLNIK